MSSPPRSFTVPEATRRDQGIATHPRRSVWVSANAGSGKTYVLSRRVIRLLLAGADPGAVLCLTFTKAAAAEMSNRVSEVLGSWAVLDDAALSAEIAALEGRTPPPETLPRARRLFARALETPGGLKIQTIHGFCEALLQRFPLEAGIAGRFTVLDERDGAARLQAAIDAAIVEAARAPQSLVGRAQARLLPEIGDEAITSALATLASRREAFTRWLEGFGGLSEALRDLANRLGTGAGDSLARIDAETLESPVFDGAYLARLRPELAAGKSTDLDLAARLDAVRLAADPAEAAGAWRDVFLRKDSGRLVARAASRFGTKGVRANLPDLEERFAAEIARLDRLEERRAALVSFERTEALARLAARVIESFEAGKAAAGALDFDDLVNRAARLLSRSDAAAWVQYKLDQGIDHLLVDEAQDTSPQAWNVISALTGEYFAGKGTHERDSRTLFAVGDEKQSIYSFQGAAPHLFGAMRADIGRRAEAAGAGYADVSLHLSFRSTPEVVKAVDLVFAPPHAHDGLSSDGGGTVHETVRAGEAGFVEVWPEIAVAVPPEPENWYDPVDETRGLDAAGLLARRIAAAVRGWLDAGERLADGRPIRPGDILVLVRKRGGFVDAMARAFGEAGIPVAGADRLKLMRHIAVMDLLALARVVLLPEDDLTLAALLKSPLIGISEDTLFTLAHGRRGFLHERLREAAATDAACRLAHERIAGWRARADMIDPYAFFAGILAADGGRRAFRARLGPEVDDVLDEFLALALAYVEGETPSLEGFLAFAAASEHEIKREMDARRNEARIMTVHGAKGLEAPVVFLVDQGSRPVHAAHRPDIVWLAPDADPAAPTGRTTGDGGPPVWVRSGRQPAAVEAAIEAERLAALQEYRRLLYVGLTRARDRLVVCGLAPGQTIEEPRWYGLVHDALVPEAETLTDAAGETTGWRWRLPGSQSPPAVP
ncbi:double-strand break repair helicase AddA, partial [Methylobrevis pamukkalensis]|uniref:double-strand break repair helicase AddA n=1 Tax=Methylobrevis pamukkalensis TaxID=1439726 RepID=UPI000845DEAE